MISYHTNISVVYSRVRMYVCMHEWVVMDSGGDKDLIPVSPEGSPVASVMSVSSRDSMTKPSGDDIVFQVRTSLRMHDVVLGTES